MMYKIWHGECQSYKDASTVSADSPKEAIIKLFSKDFKVVKSCDDRWIATDSSDDYYFISLSNE